MPGMVYSLLSEGSYEVVDEIPTEDALTAQMAKIQAMLATVEEKLAPLEAAKSEIASAKSTLIKEYEAKLADLNTKDSELRELMWETQKEVRSLKSQFESTERQLIQARKVREQMQAFDKMAERWDTLTAGAPWREWAKDHQLEAGRRMSWQTKMILADGMGLGKTLSSIIALDMIKAATEQASISNPVIFDVETKGL